MNFQTILILMICTAISCKPKQITPKLNRAGNVVATLITNTGEPLDGSNFLPAPFAFGIIPTSSDTLETFIFTKYTSSKRIGIKAFGVISLSQNGINKDILLALPEDNEKASINLEFMDFMTTQFAAKNIIDQYLMHYHDQETIKILDWKDTDAAKSILDDFIQKTSKKTDIKN